MKLSKQKMMGTALVFVLALSMFTANNFVQAQEKYILSTTEFTVKNGHEMQFEDGVKEWKACYLSNNGKWTWNMWKRYNGKGSVYVLASRSKTWAEMDESDEAGKKCRQIVMDKIIPHVECTEDNFATSIPEFSRVGTSEMNVVWASYFVVENSVLFREIINEISGIMQKAEGDKRGTWYVSNGGGPESPHFMVVTPYKDFAALDVERDGVWKMAENANGKEYADKLRANFRSSVDNSWAYLFKRMADLSHNVAQ